MHSSDSPYDKRRTALVRKLYANIFKGTIAISTIGAYITFQVIIQQTDGSLSDSGPHTFSRQTAESFPAVAWVLFVAALAVASLAAILLAFCNATMSIATGGEEQKGSVPRPLARVASLRFPVQLDTLASLTAGLGIVLVLLAFFFCSLAVSAYCEGAGWTAAAFLLLSLTAAIGLWTWHTVRQRHLQQESSRETMLLEDADEVRLSKLGLSPLGADLEAGLAYAAKEPHRREKSLSLSLSLTKASYGNRERHQQLQREGMQQVARPGTMGSVRPVAQRYQPIVIPTATAAPLAKS
jgi:hypothetical protein